MKWLLGFLVIEFICLGLIAWAMISYALDKPKRDDERRQYLIEKQEEGKRAFRLQISAEANPYRGLRYHEEDSVNWLEGYMNAKESSTQ